MGRSEGGSGVRLDAAGETIAFYGRLVELLAGGERIALCTILRLAGSGPAVPGQDARPGGRLASGHTQTGGSVGSIGGGVLEVKATAWRGEVLRTGRAICRPFVLDLQQASDEGMTCGGQVEVLVEPLEGSGPPSGPSSARSSRRGQPASTLGWPRPSARKAMASSRRAFSSRRAEL